MERTFSFIKPDAIRKNKIGAIIAMLEGAGLKIIASKMLQLTKKEAEDFYAVHKGKHFYDTLVNAVTSGPVFAIVLEGENAIKKNRDVMGATDPKKAAPGTIRAIYGNMEKMEENVVHGSDAVETAKMEISFFFSNLEICQ